MFELTVDYLKRASLFQKRFSAEGLERVPISFTTKRVLRIWTACNGEYGG